MDDIDAAESAIEHNLAQAMRHKKPPGPAPTGVCLYCEEYLDDAARWCNAWCRDRWQREVRH
jgi:hypothetical protein